ncbi:hypothetical protein [Nonomuraea sp. B19D2]|uniref:hypothetical protein n=1 Tax=Nonomuraea sp. B19D2 TaxID=3159561 RepID=UPI0032DB3BE7
MSVWPEVVAAVDSGDPERVAACVLGLGERDRREVAARGDDITELLERVLATRPAAWQADFAVRAALRLSPSPRRRRPDPPAALALAMLRRSGVVPPEHDPLVVAWVRHPPTPGDPLLDHLLPRLFEAEGVGGALRDEHPDLPAPGTWLAALAQLAREGRRDLLLDGCVRRFLRGGDAADLRFFVRLHELLEPTPDEVSKRARDYLRLLPVAPGPVAEPALRHLRRLGPGELAPADVSQALRALLFRPERKLVTGGLTWLDSVARSWAGDLDELAPALGRAFACESADVQGRAVRIAVKHAKRFTPAGAEAIRAAVGLLPQELGETLVAVFGGEAAEQAPEHDDGFTPVPLPEPRRAGRFPEPVMTAGELGPCGGGWDSAELWLAGLVRLHARDRDGLVARLSSWRLRAASHERPWPDVWQWAEEIARQIMTGGSRAPGLPRPGSVPAPHLFLLRRWAEVYAALQDGTLPPHLLAEPTEGTGHVEAAELVARLAGYERCGAEAMPADLQQALLRLPREIAPEVVARARGLTSEAGRAVARWMDGGRPEPLTEIGWLRSGRPDPDGGYRGDRAPADSRTLDLAPRIRVAPTALPLIDELFGDPGWERRYGHGEQLPWWPYVMPSHREVVALHFAPHLLHGWPAEGVRPAQAHALALAEGPWGEGMALVQAYFVADPSWSRRPEERARPVVDMAARGDLAAEGLGRQLGLLLRRTWLKPGPVFETLESAAAQGAHREVWRIMTGFLPVFLPGPGERPHTRHTQGLAFALRAARWAGARGPVPCVAEIAERRASNNFVREARRLHTYLT